MFNTTLGSDENVTDKMDKGPDPCELQQLVYNIHMV